MIQELLQRRGLVMVGKGGVGRTTVTGALATYAASKGVRVLVMESDLRAPLAALFGAKPRYQPVKLAPNLWTMTLDGFEALHEYLGLVVHSRTVLRAVFSSELYRYFVQAAPGLRELIMIGKFFHESERRSPPKWNLIILDAPASGHAINLLRMPFAARETFGDNSIVGREAQNVGRFLRNESQCGIIQLTTPEPLAVTETLETNTALAALGVKISAVIFNRATSVSFEAQDVIRLARRGGACAPELRHVADLAELARKGLKEAAKVHRAEIVVGRRTGKPIIEMPEYRGLSGQRLIRQLAARLAEL